MKALKRILTTFLALTITSLIAVWSVLAIVGSATAINKLIVASGGYETAATQTRTAMLSSANIPEQYRAIITQAFENSITAQQMEAIVQPLLVDIVGWLDQPAGTPAPQLVVNLSPLKQQLEAELAQAQISEIEKTALVAQVGKQIPDQLNLAQAQGLATQQGAEALTAPQASEAVTALETFKGVYAALQAFSIVGMGIMLVMLAGVITISRRDGRAMLRRPAWAFISAGLLATAAWIVSRVLQADQAQPTLVIAMSVAREISGIVVWYSLASIVFGSALYGLSFLLKPSLPTASAAPIAMPPTTNIAAPITPSASTATSGSPQEHAVPKDTLG